MKIEKYERAGELYAAIRDAYARLMELKSVCSVRECEAYICAEGNEVELGREELQVLIDHYDAKFEQLKKEFDELEGRQ